MSALKLEAVQYATLPDIDDVEPINDKDHEVLQELRATLAKHGYTDRFGICLLHKHFELADDEVLMETTDNDSRVSTLFVQRRGEESKTTIETMWRFSNGGDPIAGQKCVQQCDYAGGHKRVHRKVAT